jgi:hypothetical protein
MHADGVTVESRKAAILQLRWCGAPGGALTSVRKAIRR